MDLLEMLRSTAALPRPVGPERSAENPSGVLPWRLERAAYLARQFSIPTIYGDIRQMRRLEKRQGGIRTVARF